MRMIKAAAAALALTFVSAPVWAVDEAKLDAAIEARSDEDKARDPFRNPKETLTFFGIEPGMTVVEALPGGGWYTKILAPYLGADGTLIGAGYQGKMFKTIFPNMTEERLARFDAFPERFPGQVAEFSENGPAASGYLFGKAPESLKGTADAALFIRALHNLHRVSVDDYLKPALKEIHGILKPGGIVGIVQHRAPEGNSDEWADGSAGYLKQANVIAFMEAAGFEFVAASEVNANAKDTPSEEEIVWRLPPSRRGDETKRAEYDAIGESDRMTLLFKKPE